MLRVTLRAPEAGDEAEISAWLPEAVAAVAGRAREAQGTQSLGDFLGALRPRQRALVICRLTGESAGLLVVEPAGEGTETITFLAIASSDRNLGLGAEAVYALEALDQRRALMAAVPLANGLALYFWLRTGYRPLFPRSAVSPHNSRDYIWFARGGL